MADLIVILLYACKLAFLTSSTCVKLIEFSLTNEARKANLHMKEVHISTLLPAGTIDFMTPFLAYNDSTMSLDQK